MGAALWSGFAASGDGVVVEREEMTKATRLLGEGRDAIDFRRCLVP